MKQITNGTSGMKYCGPTVLGPIHMYFSIIYRHGRVMHDKVMRQFGLTGQQMGYLKYINENPGISQEELSRYAQIDKGAVAEGKIRVINGHIAFFLQRKPDVYIAWERRLT